MMIVDKTNTQAKLIIALDCKHKINK